MGDAPRILLLKQTAPVPSYSLELGADLAAAAGSCVALIGGPEAADFEGLRIMPAPAYDRRSNRTRVLSWLRYFLKAAWVVLRADRRTLLFVIAQPPLLPLLGYVRSLLWRRPYVVWVDDIYPDVLTQGGRLAPNGPMARAWRWLNRRMIGRAAEVFTLAPHMAELVQRYTKRPVRIVPTWVYPSAFPETAKADNPFAVEHGLVDKVTFLYSGNVGLTHDLSTMVEAARRLAGEPGIAFMVVGAGPRLGEVKEAARGLPNFSILPLQPEEVLPYSLAAGEVSVVALGGGFEGVSMPSKTYYGMAARSAVLALSHAPNDLQALVERHDCGVNVEPGDVDAFVAAAIRFRDDPAYLAACRANAREAAETVYARAPNTKAVFDAIRPLLAEELAP